MTISFDGWWTWATSYEPTLDDISISPTVPAVLTDTYNDAVDKCSGLESYLSDNNYTRLVYQYALHLLIVNSGHSSITQLKNLYIVYEVKSYAGIINSASDSSTSASKLIPTVLQNGDANTLLLFSTPYGQQVEATFEQLRSIAIVV